MSRREAEDTLSVSSALFLSPLVIRDPKAKLFCPSNVIVYYHSLIQIRLWKPSSLGSRGWLKTAEKMTVTPLGWLLGVMAMVHTTRAWRLHSGHIRARDGHAQGADWSRVSHFSR